MEIEQIFRYLARRHKIYSKELKALHEEKYKAVSEGTEKAAYLKVKHKEAEIRLVKRFMDFLDNEVDIEKDTWDKGLPIVTKNKDGYLINEWSDGRIEKVKIEETQNQ